MPSSGARVPSLSSLQSLSPQRRRSESAWGVREAPSTLPPAENTRSPAFHVLSCTGQPCGMSGTGWDRSIGKPTLAANAPQYFHQLTTRVKSFSSYSLGSYVPGLFFMSFNKNLFFWEKLDPVWCKILCRKMLSLTRCALANTIGSPKAETTMPVVRNMASPLQALPIASVSSTNLLAMQYGIGERI